MRRRIWSGVVALLAVNAPMVAVSGDGVLEINHSCALNAGCFPGDDPGYPVTITGTAGRSYQLTSDLNISNGDTTVIEVLADGLTIDLGGFRISCNTFVPPSTIEPCGVSGPGAGSGIDALVALVPEGLTIRNGSIVGMGRSGIRMGAGTVDQVRVSRSGSVGIRINSGTVRGCLVDDNGGAGIVGSAHALISRNVVRGNASIGIDVSRGALVERNIVTGNAEVGIRAFGGGELIRDNTVTDNGSGITMEASGSAYGGNVVNGNAAGQISGGNNIGGNFCEHPVSPNLNICP